MANPFDQFDVAQAPAVRPAPIPRPEPIERPGSGPAQRRALPPAKQTAPINPFDQFDPPSVPNTPGKGVAPQQPADAVGMAEEPAGPGRFAKGADTPPLKPAKVGDFDVEQIQSVLDNADPKLREKILQEWADAKVKEERSQGGMKGVATWIDDRVRTVARGTPVGSWLDEANAALYSLTGRPYELQLAYERAKDRARDNEASTMFNIPGTDIPVTTATGEKLIGALGSARLFPQATLMQGASYIPRAVNATATGAGYGAVYGAGEGTGSGNDILNSIGSVLTGGAISPTTRGQKTEIDSGDRLANMALGTVVGGALGPALPAIQSALTAPVNALARYMNAPRGPIAGVSRTTARKVADSMEQDGVPANYQRRVAELGPEGMLADMGDNLRMDAARIARNPGDGRNTVLNALTTRKDGAQQRITQDLDTAIGQPVPLPQTIERIRETANRQARPYYDQFYQTPMPNDPALVSALQRVPESAYAKARDLAAAEGFRFGEIRNTGRGIDYIKRAVDDIAYNAKPGSNEARIYQGLSRDIRNAVDDILSPGGTPQTRAQSPWAQARGIAGEGIRFEEAAEMGGNAFSRGLSPDQMRADMARLGFNQRAAYEMGARDQIRQIMGNSATTFGPTGDNAARRLLGSDNARQKLELVAGPQGAQRITSRLDAETAFERTRNDAMANSITSTMQGAAKKWPAPDGGEGKRENLRQSSLQGHVLAIGHRIINSLTGGMLNERALREQANAARMLVAQGADRDAIAAELIRFANRNRLAGNRRMAIERVVRDLVQSPRPVMIEAATTATTE